MKMSKQRIATAYKIIYDGLACSKQQTINVVNIWLAKDVTPAKKREEIERTLKLHNENCQNGARMMSMFCITCSDDMKTLDWLEKYQESMLDLKLYKYDFDGFYDL